VLWLWCLWVCGLALLLDDPVPANASDDKAIRSAAAKERILVMVCLLRIERGQMTLRLVCSIGTRTILTQCVPFNGKAEG